MKKLLRLAGVFLTPLLLVVFVNVALAEIPISRPQIGRTVIQAPLDALLVPPTDRLPSNQGPITGQAIVGLAIIHTTPALLNEPVFFTATLSSGTPPISYSWSFGDNSSAGPNAGAVVSHTYDAIGSYTVVVTAQNIVGIVSRSAQLIVTTELPGQPSITHSTPTLLNTPINFTATVIGGTNPISYAWSFGDGTPSSTNARPTVSHTYHMTGTYTVVATASNVAGSVDHTAVVTVEAEAITGLSISHSAILSTHIPIVFTATKETGTPPVTYGWSFGDGSDPIFNAGPVQPHIFAETGNYSVTVVAFNNIGPPVSTSILIPVAPSTPIFLPLVFHNAVFKADLTCSLSLDPPEPAAGQPVLITVEVKNEGIVGAAGFWVDFYLDPIITPGPNGNLIRWQDTCADEASCQGIAWGVEDVLAEGASKTLVSRSVLVDSDGYIPEESNWSGALPEGIHDLYVYVDSIDNPILVNTDGAVMEISESNNRCEILDLMVSPARNEVSDQAEGRLEPNQPGHDQLTPLSGPHQQSQPWSRKLPPR
jgi:PKD repeat protein